MNFVDHLDGEEYQSIFENAMEGIFQSSIDGRFLKVNPALARIYGFDSPEDMLNCISDTSRNIHVDVATRKQFVEELIKHERVEGFEARNYRKDGSIIWTRTNARTVRDENGEILYFEGFLTDITLYKETEIALRASEEQFKRIFQDNPIASLIATFDEGQFIAANDAFWNLTGYTAEELHGHTSIEMGFISNEKRNDLALKLKKEQTIRNVHGNLITKSGEFRNTLEFYELVCFDNQDCILTMFYDVTDQVKGELELRENEERYRQLFEAESDAIFLIDNETGKILEVNEAATILYGYSKEELLTKKNSDLSAEVEETRKVTQNTPLKKDRVVFIPLRFHRKKDGTVFPVEITGRFFEWRGRAVHIAAIRDITERRRVEEALRESEQKFRNIVEHTTNIYYSHTPDHILTFLSPQTREILGYEPSEALINWHEFLTDNPMNQEGIELTQKAIDTGKRQKPYTLELKRRDGKKVWVEVNESPILQDGKTVLIVGALIDITERKRAEDIFNHQLKELTILHNIAVAASSSRSLDELIKRATDTIFETLHPDNCGVELVTDHGEAYKAHPSYRGAGINEIRKSYPLSKGITGKVISSGIPLRLGDVSQDPAFIEATKGIHSELCVPVMLQARVIGAINIESKQTDAYDKSDERLLSTIAGTLATAIEQLRLFETSQRQLKELSILNRVGLASTDATSADELIEKVTLIIGESLYPDNFGVLLLNADSTKLSPHPSYRGISFGKFPTNFALDQGICGLVTASGKPLRIANVRNHKNYIEVTPQVRSEVCVPIAHGDRIFGVINAESLNINAFTEDDEQLLATIASTLATAIEKLRLLEEEKKRRQETETLLVATTTLTTSLNTETLLETILETLARIVPFDSASIAMEQDGNLLIVAERGFPPSHDMIGKQLAFSEKRLLLSATQIPIIVPDILLDTKFEPWKSSEKIRGWMGVPMVVHGKLKGFINLESQRTNAFTEHDAILAQTFANSAAVAIENARLFEVEQQNRQKAEALRDATAALTATIELESLYETILNSLANLLPFDRASIEVIEQGFVKVVAGYGFKDEQSYLGQEFKYDDTKWSSLETLRNPIIISDVRKDPRLIKFEGTGFIRSWMGVPMFVQDKLVGFLNFDSSTRDFFTKDHAALAQTFGNHAAVAIENARLFQEESRRTQIIEAMANIANEFATAQEITPVLEKITHRTLELLQASTVAIYLLQDDDQIIKVVTAVGAYSEQLMSHTIQIGTGITGNIIATGKPEIIDDMLKDLRRVRVPGTPVEDAQRDTIMSAPLILRGKTIGAINAWRQRSSGLFNESELNFLVSIANQTSISIDSIHLLQETSRRAQEAHAIAEVGRDISSTLQLDIVLERIAQYAKELLNAVTSAVYLADQDAPLLRAIASVGEEVQEIKDFPLRLGSGILGNIALQKSGEIVNYTPRDPRAITIIGTEIDPDEHLMGVSVLSKGQLTGLLAVWRTGEGNEFKTYELDFLSSLAQQAAVAIENARLFEGEQRHFQEAETLRQAAESITSTLDIQEVLASILDNLNRVVPFDSAGVFLIENDQARLTACKGMPENVDAIGQLLPADNELFLEIWQTGRPFILKDAQSDPRFEKWVVDRTRSWMGIPLIARGTIIGYITIDSLKIDTYKEHDATLAMTFAHQAAVAIENARLYERGEQQIRQLTVLRDIDSAISSSFDLRVTLNLLIGYAARDLDADAVTVLLYNPDLKSLYLYTNIGFTSKQNITTSHIRIGEGLAGRVVLHRKLIQISDLSGETEFHPAPYASGEKFKSYFGVPLISKGQIKGVMEIFTHKESNPDPEWLNFLQTLAGQAAIAIDNAQLFRNLQRSNQELILAYDTTLAGWGRALELRDKETQGHTDRVVELTLELARRMGVEGDDLTHIMRGTLLHDIGKMGIPDQILHKPGPLNEEEWESMRQHPQYAFDLMNPIPYLRQALDIPFAHHERWDGSGYPRGLKGQEIPLAARIFAVVDIWDALLYDRVYRNAWPEDKVIDYLKNTAGIELDPVIVEKFLELVEEKRLENQAD